MLIRKMNSITVNLALKSPTQKNKYISVWKHQYKRSVRHEIFSKLVQNLLRKYFNCKECVCVTVCVHVCMHPCMYSWLGTYVFTHPPSEYCCSKGLLML